MLNLGSRVTSGGMGEAVRLGVAAIGKFSGCRSWLIEMLGASGSCACMSERKVLG